MDFNIKPRKLQDAVPDYSTKKVKSLLSEGFGVNIILTAVTHKACVFFSHLPLFAAFLAIPTIAIKGNFPPSRSPSGFGRSFYRFPVLLVFFSALRATFWRFSPWYF
jgi:hypothetical protein